MVRLRRILRHIVQTKWGMRRCFPASTLGAIERAVHEGERGHDAEIRFAIETELAWPALLADQSPRERACEVFSHLRVWDTERNNGVLIYVLMADHAVEIVADRAFTGLVAAGQWQSVCRGIEQRFAAGDYEVGAVAGIAAVHQLVAAHFPATPGDRNELPNRPVVL